MSEGDPLPRHFFARTPTAVSRNLLGCHLVSAKGDMITAGRIVETEAYHGPDDLASHSASRRTGRVQAMHKEVGLAYVYRSYGMHVMLNVVAHKRSPSEAIPSPERGS